MLVALAIVVALASMYFGHESVLGIVGLFVVTWPFERFFRRHPVPIRRLALRTDLAYAAAQPALQIVSLVVGIIIGVLSLAWIPGLLLRPFVTSLSPLVQLIAGFLLFDVLAYWTHRWAHTVPLFSSKQLALTWSWQIDGYRRFGRTKSRQGPMARSLSRISRSSSLAMGTALAAAHSVIASSTWPRACNARARASWA